ncbi:MAG TPA: hypothetical protein PLG58_07480 [Flexilinea sp.]|nr:hypothetical protein [Flexilinea sp.]
MPFDVLDFIPSPEVREECWSVGKVFTTREKAAIVSWSDKPMQERINAYQAIGEEGIELQNDLFPLANRMRQMLKSFQKSEEGFIYFFGDLHHFNGFLHCCADTVLDTILEASKANGNFQQGFRVVKTAVGQNNYSTARFDQNRDIIDIFEVSPQQPNRDDPEEPLREEFIFVPTPFRKGDLVCFKNRPDDPMIFTGQEPNMHFKAIQENHFTGRIEPVEDRPSFHLTYFRQTLPHSELKITAQALRGELDFVTAFDLLRSYRCNKELDQIDKQFEQDYKSPFYIQFH